MPSSPNLRMFKTDIFFGMMIAGSVVMLAVESYSAIPAVSAPDRPLLVAAISISAMFALSLLITILAGWDRHRSDEYAFRLLGNAAVVAIPTTLLFHILFGQGFLLGGVFGRISADALYAVLLGSWATGYFSYRVRGTLA